MKFLNDNKAYGAMIASMIGLVLAIILIGVIVMPTIHNAYTGPTYTCGTYGNTTCNNAWNAAELALWGILGLLVVVGALQMVTGK
jgi:hypothetical protein